MYKNLTEVIPDTRDPAIQHKELIEYLQREFFDNEDNTYQITKALHDKGVTSGQYAAFHQCAELNATDIKKTLAKPG